jgi:hypothetical protein
MNTLTITHRGARRTFRFAKGGYAIDGERISISIETWADDKQSPYAANLSLVNYPLPQGALRPGLQLAFSDDHAKGWDDQDTHANAYFDFHAEAVRLTFEVLAVERDALTVRLSATTEDYGLDRDDKPNPIEGTFRLPKTPKGELWIPT